jgi:chromosome segregation ATPase
LKSSADYTTTEHPILVVEPEVITIFYLHPNSSRPKRVNEHLASKSTKVENNLSDCLRFQNQGTAQLGTFHNDISKIERKTHHEYLEVLHTKFNHIMREYNATCKTTYSKAKTDHLRELQEQLADIRKEMNHRLLSRKKNKDIRESIRRSETKLQDLCDVIHANLKSKRSQQQRLITFYAQPAGHTPVTTHTQGDQNDDFRDSSD